MSRAQETISAAEKLLQQLDGEHTRWTAQVCVCMCVCVREYLVTVAVYVSLSLHQLPAVIKSHVLTSEDMQPKNHFRVSVVYVGGF